MTEAAACEKNKATAQLLKEDREMFNLSEIRGTSKEFFSSTEKKPRFRPVVKGASILLVSLTDDGLNLPCVLLARERKAKWLQNQNHVYTDFGGAANSASESAELIASREFVEESLGVVRYFNDPHLDDTRELESRVQQSLESGEYLAKIVTPLGKGQQYVTFVKQVPWQPRVTMLFKQTRALLRRSRYDYKNMDETDQALVKSHPAATLSGTNSVNLDDGCLEKVSVDYFSLAAIQFYLDTGSSHVLSDFTCMTYFKSRLRTVAQIFQRLLQEAELLRLPPPFSHPVADQKMNQTKKPTANTSRLLTQPLSSSGNGICFVPATPGSGVNFNFLKNGHGSSTQWRWKPKKPEPGAPGKRLPRPRRKVEERFKHGPLSDIAGRISIDNKQRWTVISDLYDTCSCISDNSSAWNGGREQRNRSGRSGERPDRPGAARRSASDSSWRTGSVKRDVRQHATNRFFQRHGKSGSERWARK